MLYIMRNVQNYSKKFSFAVNYKTLNANLVFFNLMPLFDFKFLSKFVKTSV